jgi:hypothetical protein
MTPQQGAWRQAREHPGEEVVGVGCVVVGGRGGEAGGVEGVELGVQIGHVVGLLVGTDKRRVPVHGEMLVLIDD